MKNEELIKQAVKVHFAVTNSQLSCSTDLENGANIARDFLDYLTNNNLNDGVKKALKTERGKIKLELIKRYIKNESISR